MIFDISLAQYFDFRSWIYQLQSIGVYDVFLPFLLVFSIVFAILEKTKIFGGTPIINDKKEVVATISKTNINAVVSMIFGLLLVAQPIIVDTINLFLPRVALIIVVILMFLLVMSMVTQGNKIIHLEGWALALATLVIIVALFIALSPTFDIDPNTRDSILRIILPLAVLFGVFKLITGSSTPPAEGTSTLDKLIAGIHYK